MLALIAVLCAGFQCKEGLYNYKDHACVIADECSSIGEYYCAYNAVRRCIFTYYYGDSKPTKQDDGSYECEEDFYLKFEYSDNGGPRSVKVTCMESEDGCNGLYML